MNVDIFDQGMENVKFLPSPRQKLAHTFLHTHHSSTLNPAFKKSPVSI